MEEKNKCQLCGRPLRSPISIERGYGMGCFRKINPVVKKKKKNIKGYFREK
jgi:hypothetical protein